MIELKTSDGYPIPYLVNKLNKLIGKDKITLEPYYVIRMTDGLIYYTKQNYQQGQPIEVYDNPNFSGDPILGKCVGSSSVIINNEYGTFDLTPLCTGTDLLATEKAVVNYIEENIGDLVNIEYVTEQELMEDLINTDVLNALQDSVNNTLTDENNLILTI